MRYPLANKLIYISVLFLLTFANGFAQSDDCFPKQSNPPLMVEDRANLFTDQERSALEMALRSFQDSTSNQILILTVTSLCDYDKAEFATKIGHEWGVGQSKFDNGIVILVKPKYSDTDKGEAYIAVGYGLEGIIPDVTAFSIIENEMIPEFKKGEYFKGVKNATVNIMKLAAGEISSDEYAHKNKGGQRQFPFELIFIVIVLIFIFARGRKGGGGSNGRRDDSSLWLLPFLFMNSGRGSTYSGGGFSSGGGFGGGFGGFGGGGFGGGGAGGSW